MGDLYKTQNKYIMQNQETVNAIAVLSVSIDSFHRVGISSGEIDVLVNKILELAAKL